jgi:primosomal protein N' (replication factor Y) (superfamily II helicase)
MKKILEKVIIDVAPITRLPLSGSQSFSYLHSQKLNPGTLVSIPLFKRNVEGIVTDNRPDFERLGNIKLKKINTILEENFLDQKQLELARFISDYYFSPLGVVLKSFIPKRVKSRNAYRVSHNVKSKKNITLTKEQHTAVTIITEKVTSKFKIQNSKFLLYGPSGSGKTEVYIHAIKKLKEINKESQFLILLPELTLTPQAIERYGEYFGASEIALLGSKISKGELYANWQKIKSGKTKIIIGTRLAVFAPFKKLELIVIDEEQDPSFKQWDMNPRYDARRVAEKLAEIHGAKIVRGSATPSIESYYQAYSKKYNLLKLPKLDIPNAKYQILTTKIELVDMKKERWSKNYSTISKKLKSEIAYALKNKLQTILFVNRQGMSAFSVCADCQTILKCPRCDRALIYENTGTYRCAHCAHKTSITPQCPNCKGINFQNVGLGTQKIEREITSLFPDARIARADSQSMKGRGAQENLYRKFMDREIDILIGTQMISKGWDLPNLALIGIIDGDNLLTLPDFSTTERAFQIIMQITGRVNRPGAKFTGLVLLQTFAPEQNFFKLMAEKDMEKIYAKEIEERKALQLPPFGKLIKLTFQDYKKSKVVSETNRLYEMLKKQAEKSVKVSEPQDAFVPNIRGRFRKQILLKITKNIPKDLEKILKSLPNGWIIDVDPITIL